MIIKEEIFVPKELVKEKIDLLVENLTTIKDDNGEFLLDFDGLKVDDKSWTVWNWPQGVGLYGIYKNYQMTKNPRAYQVVNEWFEDRMEEGAPPKNVNTMAPLLTMAYLYEEQQTSPPAYTGKPCVVIGGTLQRQLDREESHRSRQQHSQRTEFGTVKGHRQSQQGRDKTGYGRYPCKDAGI